MSKRVNKLLGLEIDEVSLVDRPANQHGLVTITKRDEDPVDEFYDADGNLLDSSELQPYDVVFNADGEQIELTPLEDLSDDELAELGIEIPDDLSELDDYEDEDADERQLAGVGKAAPAVTGGERTAFQAGRKLSTRLLGDLRGGYAHGRSGVAPANYGPTTRGGERARKTGAFVGRNRDAVIAGGGGGSAAFATGHHRGRKSTASKSLGAEVLAELSKAYTDGDRDQIVSKAVEMAESRAQAAERRANIAFSKAERLEQQRELEAYVELAKSYELPVEAEDLGEILQVIAKSGLTEEQLNLVDRIFIAAGETAIYDEVGKAGIAPSSVEEVVKARAYELVGKNDLSLEQATTALFEADDRAYLEYLAETGH